MKTVLELMQEALDSGAAVEAAAKNTITKLQKQLISLYRDIATAERGGDETVLEPTVLGDTVLETTEIDSTALAPNGGGGGTEATEMLLDEDEEMEDVDVTTQLLQRSTMRDTTLGATTIGAPDAEGTRVGLGGGGGDTELLFSEEEDETEF